MQSDDQGPAPKASAGGSTPQRQPLPPIRFEALAQALLARAGHLVPAWLQGGHSRGHEYVCGGLGGGAGKSCSVNLTTGAWADFATGEQGGDLISLYAAMHGMTMGKAAVQVARDEGLEDVAGVQPDRAHQRPVRPPPPPAQPKPRESEGWRTVRPVPAHALQIEAPEKFKHHFRAFKDIEHVATYQHGDDVHGYVVRFRTSDGGKDTLPRTWCQSIRDSSMKWHWKQFDEPRPLYLPGHQLPGERTVVLVEGEKKGDALQALLDGGAPGVYCVASWPGGCKAWDKADWSILQGRTVICWPDCDSKRVPLTPAERKATPDEAEQATLAASKPFTAYVKQPGMHAMRGIGAHLREKHGCQVSMLPIAQPGELKDGWDCADAIAHDGWDFDRVMGFFAQAYALEDEATPAPDGDAPAGASGGGDPPAGSSREGPADAEDDGSSGRGPGWLSPFWNRKKHYWMVSRELVIAALENDAMLQGMFAVNELTNNVDICVQPPWSNGRLGPITNSTELLLGRYLSQRYGLPAISRAALMEGIETVAHGHPFHPVRQYLHGIHEGKVWDGTARLDKWLLYAIGETPESLPPRVVEYLTLVGRFLLLGMVNRVMEPGCKFDYCMVLEGPGGLRKTTMVQVLASKPWFSNTHFDVGRGKDGQEQVQGLWVYEIAELASFSKGDINLIKAFISAEVDRYRPSYGRVVEAFPRQCVMVGTTNEKQWLRDRTGNRRFWPVPVRHRINTDWLAKYRDQLLAEAFAAYLEGQRYYPTPEEEERLFVPMQDKRLVESTVMSALLEVLTRPPAAAGIGAVVNELTNFVTIKQLNEALHVDAGKSTAALDGQIRSWLDAEGWEYCKKQINGVRAHGYARPKDWPRELPDDTDAGTDVAPTKQPDGEPPGPYEQDADDAPF